MIAGAILGLLVAATPYRAAIVVAYDRAPDPALARLEFADDDAARYAELFDPIADRTELLTVLDAESQRFFPDLLGRARPPDLRTLRETLASVYRDLDARRTQGQPTELFVILIGHGQIDAQGEGVLQLLDGPFRRSDLHAEIIERSPATTTHVIIDACHSYFLVAARGGEEGPSYAELIRAHTAQERLGARPGVGLILSTSGAKESHEWSGFRAGVFSHQVRSALTGAADVDLDGTVDYAELHAFIAAANAKVDDARARTDLYLAPPAGDRRAPLVSLASTRFRHFLQVPAGRPFRFYLEDDRGIRYADLHADGEVAPWLALAPRPAYYLRDLQGEVLIELPPAGGRVVVEPEDLSASALTKRGAVADAFRDRLFAEPYGPRFVVGFAVAQGYPRAPSRPAFAPQQADLTASVVSLEGIRRRTARLAARADADPALRARLAAGRKEIARAVARRDLPEAARLLRAAERP